MENVNVEQKVWKALSQVLFDEETRLFGEVMSRLDFYDEGEDKQVQEALDLMAGYVGLKIDENKKWLNTLQNSR